MSSAEAWFWAIIIILLAIADLGILLAIRSMRHNLNTSIDRMRDDIENLYQHYRPNPRESRRLR